MKSLPWTTSCLIGLVALGSSLAQEPKLETRSYDVNQVLRRYAHSPAILAPQGRLVFWDRMEHEDGPISFMGGFDEDEGPDATSSWEGGMPLFGRPSLGEHDYYSEGDFEDVSIGLGHDGEGYHCSGIRKNLLVERLAEHLGALNPPRERTDIRIQYAEGMLRVHAPPEGHEIVRRFLDGLEKEARRVLRIECLLLPPELLHSLAPAWRSEGPYLPPDVFQKALLDDRSRLFRVVARNGQRVSSGGRGIQPLLAQREVNQTGVIPVIPPVIRTPFSGERIEACARLIPGRGGIWLELVIGTAEVQNRETFIGDRWGKLDLPTIDQRLVSTAVVTEPGKVLVAGSMSGERGLVALIRVNLLGGGNETSPAPKKGRSLERYDLSLLWRGSPERSWFVEGPFWTPPPLAKWDSEEIPAQLGLDTVEAQGGHVSLAPPEVLLSGPAAIHEKLRQHLTTRIEALSRLVTVEIRFLELSREDVAGILSKSPDGCVLAADWENAVKRAKDVKEDSYAIAGVAGQPLALFGAETRRYVADVELVSGGTGFATISVADPIEVSCGDGRELRLRVDPGGSPATARLRLQAGEARIVEKRSVVPRFPSLSVVSTSKDSSKDSNKQAEERELAQSEMHLTLPRQKVRYWPADLDVPLDRDVILHADLPRGKTGTLLVGRVRFISGSE